MFRPRLFLTALLLCTAQSARAEDRYFLMVFSAQAQPNLVRYSHTFATFVHARGEGDAGIIKEVVDISWLPKTLMIHPLRYRAEAGVNLDLHRSIRLACCNGSCVSMWGPYETCPDLFAKAVDRAQYLDSGIPQYNVLNRRRRPLVLDCVHGLAHTDLSRGQFHTRLGHGDVTSYFVTHHFGMFILDPCVTHDWVAERLGVLDYPVRRRGYHDTPSALLPLLPPTYTPVE